MGTLYIVSTPIGNLDDITVRALQTLFTVNAIACEDTRVTGQLLELLKHKFGSLLASDTKPTFISYRDTNEETVVPELMKRLESGESIAIVSDAGTPLISDPGYKILHAAIAHEVEIEVIPGVSAFLTALTGSGLPANTFTFLGYLPEKPGKRITLLTSIREVRKNIASTYVFYVAPHKFIQTLDDMEEVFGDILLVVARELTKLHEEFWRGSVSQAREHFQNPKGEFVLLFSF